MQQSVLKLVIPCQRQDLQLWEHFDGSYEDMHELHLLAQTVAWLRLIGGFMVVLRQESSGSCVSHHSYAWWEVLQYSLTINTTCRRHGLITEYNRRWKLYTQPLWLATLSHTVTHIRLVSSFAISNTYHPIQFFKLPMQSCGTRFRVSWLCRWSLDLGRKSRLTSIPHLLRDMLSWEKRDGSETIDIKDWT